MSETQYLECPCCGGHGVSVDGPIYDGDSLLCGCPGWVSVDEDGAAWINNGDEPCHKCAAEEVLARVEQANGQTSADLRRIARS